MLGNISPKPTRMKLNLKKPLIVFDLETTGLDLVKDRIIQMSYIKVNTDGSEVRKNLYVNPGKTIPQEVVELTGISNEDVKDAPTFKELAPTLNQDFRVATLPVITPITSTYLCLPRNFSVPASTSTSQNVVSSMRRPSS